MIPASFHTPPTDIVPDGVGLEWTAFMLSNKIKFVPPGEDWPRIVHLHLVPKRVMSEEHRAKLTGRPVNEAQRTANERLFNRAHEHAHVASAAGRVTRQANVQRRVQKAQEMEKQGHTPEQISALMRIPIKRIKWYLHSEHKPRVRATPAEVLNRRAGVLTLTKHKWTVRMIAKHFGVQDYIIVNDRVALQKSGEL